MFEEEKILIIAKFGIESYSLLAKLASSYDNIIWIASNPYIPHKVLEIYSRKAKIFGFYSRFGRAINPLSLNEISLAISHGGGGRNLA